MFVGYGLYVLLFIPQMFREGAETLPYKFRC